MSMKMITAIIATMSIINHSAWADCASFPEEDGLVEKTVTINSDQYTIRANFSKSEVQAYGGTEMLKMHTYSDPTFYMNGEEIYVNHGASRIIFEALGYEYLSYAIQMTAPRRFFNKLQYLDENLEVREANSNTVIIDPQGSIQPYHSSCADWVY